MTGQHEAERGENMAHSNVNRISGNESDWWRVLFVAIGLLYLILSSTSQVVGAEPTTVWRSDYKSALQEAEEKKLPLLLHFYAEWCMPCQRMERDVFSKPAVKSLIGNRFIAVKIDSDHHQDLVRQYGVETLPSDVFVDSLTGRTIDLQKGFQEQSEYVSSATKAEARFVKAHAGDLVIAKSESNGTQTMPAIDIKTGRIELGDPQPVIGLD